MAILIITLVFYIDPVPNLTFAFNLDVTLILAFLTLDPNLELAFVLKIYHILSPAKFLAIDHLLP